MSTVTFHVTPGYGDTLLEQLGFSQAVRVGNRVETSGQGGWDDELTIPADLEEEIVRTFENVERTLAVAGAGWGNVIHVNSYHKARPGEDAIGQDHNRVMVEQFRRRLGTRAPIWTQTGVTVLGLAAMRIEIRVTAIVGDDG